MPSLVDKIISGSIWVSVIRVGQKVFSALKQIILARLLFPEDFGLFGIASLMLLAFEVLTRTGFEDAIIHIQDDIKEYLHTSYWIQIIRGCLIGLIVYFAAPTIASFFDEPRIVSIVRVLALTEVLKGFKSIGIVVLRKEMDFKTESIFLFIGVLAHFIVTVGLAIVWQSVWVLVWGSVASELVKVITSFYFHDYRPRFLFDWKKAKDLFRYGIWLLAAGIVSYIALQADNIFVGKLIGVSALGVYQMAYFVANLPTSEIAKQIGKVVQSSYAEVQENKEQLKKTFQQTFQIISVLLIPAVIGLVLLNERLVLVVLGDKWVETIHVLPILALGALFRGVSAIAASLFKATGYTSYVFRVEFVRSGTLLTGLGVCSYFNISLLFVSWAYVGSTLTMFIYYMVLYEKKYSGSWVLLYSIWPALISGSFLAVCTSLLSGVLNTGMLSLIMIILAGFLVYSVLILFLEKVTGDKIILNLLKRFKLLEKYL